MRLGSTQATVVANSGSSMARLLSSKEATAGKGQCLIITDVDDNDGFVPNAELVFLSKG